MNINPGELKHRIQIIRRDRTADADGYDTITETVVHTCSAKLTQVSGTELVQANAVLHGQRCGFSFGTRQSPLTGRCLCGTPEQVTRLCILTVTAIRESIWKSGANG